MRFNWQHVNTLTDKTTRIKRWREHLKINTPSLVVFDTRRKRRIRFKKKHNLFGKINNNNQQRVWRHTSSSKIPVNYSVNWVRLLLTPGNSSRVILGRSDGCELEMLAHTTRAFLSDTVTGLITGSTQNRLDRIASTVYNFHWGFFPSNTIVMADSNREYTPTLPIFSWSFSYLFLILEGKKYKKRDWSLLWNANTFILTLFFNGLVNAIKRLRITSSNLILSKKLNKGTPGFNAKGSYQLDGDMDVHLTQNLVHHFWTFKKKFRSLPRRIRRRIYKLKQGRIWVNRVR